MVWSLGLLNPRGVEFRTSVLGFGADRPWEFRMGASGFMMVEVWDRGCQGLFRAQRSQKLAVGA